MKKSMTGMALAFSLAVAGVIATGCAGDGYKTRSTGTYIDDTAVSTKVKTQLLTDKEVHSGQVQVRTYNGEVQLSGFVDSAEEKDRAIAIARAVQGVKMVRDDLVVKQPLGVNANGKVTEPAGAQAPAPINNNR